MQSRSAYVEVLFPAAAVQNPEGQNICQQPRHGNHHHCRPGDRLRVSETLYGLPDDKNGNDHQRNGVNKRGQGCQPQPAEGMARIGRTTRKLHRQQGEEQRCGIGQHVSCISQKRQRAGNQAANDLDNHKRCRDAKGQHQSFSVVVAGSV